MSLKSNFLYILRFCIEPGHKEKEKLEELIDFCKTALIDDVMFFIDCEDLNQGHITKEELMPWLDLIKEAKEVLDPMGITTSINPWITLNHADRGRILKPGQNFQLMVDPNGQKTTACACPMCEEWIEYIVHMYSSYASLKPEMLWIEDDFRFHNHAPLGWGGCFCSIHMEEYSKRLGRPVTREAFVKGILSPGAPNQYRKVWLDVARDNIASLAHRIGKAVNQVSGDTRLGLMSSYPEVHCAEGRDWIKVLEGLSQGNPMVNRPHLPSYQEVSPQRYLWDFNTFSVLSKANVPMDTEIYPELENSPRTLFSKSRQFSKFQILMSTILGSHGITMNIFNVMGNGITKKDKFQDMLKETKPFLNKVLDLKISEKTPTGVKVLFDPKSSYTLHTNKGERMEELYPAENFWSGLLGCYGISHCYSKETHHEDEVLAISGQYFRNLDYDQIKHLLHNNFVLLDGKAVNTLVDLGYGELLGIEDITWYPQHHGKHAYEQVSNGQKYYGLDEARISLQRALGGFYEIRYKKDHHVNVVTRSKSPDGRDQGPSMTLVNHKTFILPSNGLNEFFDIHLDSIKQDIIKSMIKTLGVKGRPAYTEDAPYIAIYTYKGEEEDTIIVANASGDNNDCIGICVPGLNKDLIKEIIEISDTGSRSVTFTENDLGELAWDASINNLDIKAYQIQYN